jgi:hypothetical protein
MNANLLNINQEVFTSSISFQQNGDPFQLIEI